MGRVRVVNLPEARPQTDKLMLNKKPEDRILSWYSYVLVGPKLSKKWQRLVKGELGSLGKGAFDIVKKNQLRVLM